MTLPQVLCVDDEPRVLEGMQRILRKSFEVSTAGSGPEALARLEGGHVFEVVVSDMQMPQMNGATLLAAFRLRAPETTRVLLTGQTDLDAAIAAVNRGQIFRFLTKPCAPDDLVSALEAAVSQYRLVSAERVLLEQTLVGSVRALTEVLSLVHPEVFGSTMHGRVRAVAEHLGILDAWHLEVASMLSLVGYVVLPSDVATKLRRGARLEGAEFDMAREVPGVVERVLAHIPRLEKVREALKGYDILRSPQPLKGSPDVGPQILWAASELSSLEARLGDFTQALQALRATGQHSTRIIDAIAHVARKAEYATREVMVEGLDTGMIFAQPVMTEGGVLLIAQGQAVTEQLVQRIRNFHRRVGVVEPIICEVPKSALPAPAASPRTTPSA